MCGAAQNKLNEANESKVSAISTHAATYKDETQKEKNLKVMGQEINKEIKNNDNQQRTLSEANKAAELRDLERQEQIKQIEILHLEKLKEKESESKRIALEKDAALAEIIRANEDKIKKIESEKLEYTKKYEELKVKTQSKWYILVFVIIITMAIGGVYVYTSVLNSSTTIQGSANEANASIAEKADASGAKEIITPITKEDNSFAPSFNCAKASIEVERLICEDKELASLDVELNQLYKQSINSGKDSVGLRNGQIEWMKTSRNQCVDKECLMTSYTVRISELSN